MRIGLYTIEAADVDALRRLIKRHRIGAEQVFKKGAFCPATRRAAAARQSGGELRDKEMVPHGSGHNASRSTNAS